MKMMIPTFFVATATLTGFSAMATTTPATKPTVSKVYFASPKDGETLTSTVKVKMGLDGFKIGAVGDLDQTKGHHHIVVDGGPIKKGEVVPTDDKHLHFGKGQTETEVKLTPGKHTLTLQFADGAHRSYGPEMSSTITITVK